MAALPWQGSVTPTWLTWGQLAAGLVFHLRRGLGWVLFTLATPFEEVEQVLLRLAYDLEPLESSGPTPVFSLLSAVGAALAWPGGLLNRLAWRTLPDGAFIEPYVPESLGEWSRYTSSRMSIRAT